MTDFVVFTLYGPMASWGDVAPGELRGSWDRPSRSAILGLLGAALGLERSDQAAHDALNAGYGVAVRLDLTGLPGVDYHTAQTLAASAARRLPIQTRAAHLAGRDLETILSQRAYRQDALATIAVWALAGARWSLSELEGALERPGFVLYAGRKAHPLGLPTNPVLVSEPTLAAALKTRNAWPSPLSGELGRLARAGGGATVEVSHDSCVGFSSGLTPLRTERRRDSGANRIRWQFSERAVEVGVVPEEASS